MPVLSGVETHFTFYENRRFLKKPFSRLFFSNWEPLIGNAFLTGNPYFLFSPFINSDFTYPHLQELREKKIGCFKPSLFE